MQPRPYAELSDIEIFPLAVWREARGESLPGKRGVGHVIKNRADNARWWGGPSISSVILCPEQFSSFNIGDPNEKKWPDDNDPSFIDCSTVCDAILSGTDEDLTDGADSYYSIDIPEPYWAASSQLTLEIDHFRFFKTR